MPPKVRFVPHFKMLLENNVRRGFLQDAHCVRLFRECAAEAIWRVGLLETAYAHGWRDALGNSRASGKSLPDFSTCVRQDAEAGQAVGEAARDPDRNSQVESCHSLFTEPHWKDGSQQDGQKQDDRCCDHRLPWTSFQPCVFCFGFFQDGDVRVSIFPEVKEDSVLTLRLGGIPLQHVCPAQLPVCQCPDGLVPHDPTMLEDFLKLGGCLAPLMQQKVSLSSDIDRIQSKIQNRETTRGPQFIGSGRSKKVDGL